MSAAAIAVVLGGARREGRAWRCRCPLHGGHSLVVRDGEAGRILATCFGGCDRLDVLAELHRCGLLAGSVTNHRPYAAGPHRTDTGHTDDARRIIWARRIWDAALPAAGSPVAPYLVGRCITMPPPPSLRWAPRCWHGEARRELPAMVARVEHVERGFVGVHRTYLRADGSGKADLPKRLQKLSLGPIGGGAVRLGLPRLGEWFVTAEGIESVAAVMISCGRPGWAALSAGGLRALILPPEATHVLIAADHDRNGVGQRAAYDAAARWLAEGRQVRVAIPPEPDTDFADVLAASAAAESRNVA
jgi:hypothetical protein